MGTITIIYNFTCDAVAFFAFFAFSTCSTCVAFRTSYTRVTFFAFFAFLTISKEGCCWGAVAVGNSKSMGTIIVIGHRCSNALTINTIFTFQTFIELTFGINLKFISIIAVCSHFQTAKCN